jgi:hypothetical protein
MAGNDNPFAPSSTASSGAGWDPLGICRQVDALVATVRDPLRHLRTDGSGKLPAAQHPLVELSVHLGGANDRDYLAVSRASLSTPEQAIAAASLLNMYYDSPSTLQTCARARGWLFPRARVRTLQGLASFAKSPGFGGAAVPAVGPVSYALLRIFGDPSGSRAPSFRQYDTEVVAAATDVVRESKTPVFDGATWIPLWGWALGGAQGQASVRTRVFAMKAIQAILRRRALLPGQIRAADSMAAVLRQLVEARAPTIPVAERDLFLSEAAATVGAVAQAQIEVEGGGWTPPPPAAPAWLLPSLAAGAGLLVVGGAVVIARARARA